MFLIFFVFVFMLRLNFILKASCNSSSDLMGVFPAHKHNSEICKALLTGETRSSAMKLDVYILDVLYA